MSYPVYIGKNPKHLVDETKAIVNGSKIPTLKSATDFGNQMICIANYFLTKEVRETGRNTGQFIDEWNTEYSNDDQAFEQQAAWCAIFMWKLGNEAAKLLRCTNPLPDYKQRFLNPQTNKNDMVWGNARHTLEYLKQQGIKLTKSIPVPGCMMFRNSKYPNSSGHWGIVTDVTKDKFRTIEGNITLSDGTDGVGYWEYNNDEIINPENGIFFAHVQDNPGCLMELQPYNGFACPVEKIDEPKEIVIGLPKCIKKVGETYFYTDPNGKIIAKAQQFKENGPWYIMGTHPGEGWVEVTNCNYEQTPLIVQKEQPKQDEIVVKDYSPSKDIGTPTPEKKQKCKNVIVAVPPINRLQHYSVLRDNVVLSDITGANLDRVSEARRNGSALWYNHTDKINPKTHTGFGLFRDDMNNLIYFLDANQPQSSDILKTGFLGYRVDPEKLDFPDSANHLVIILNANTYNGAGWKERFTNDLAISQIRFGDLDNVDHVTGSARLFMLPNSNLNHKVNYRTLSEKTLFGYIRELEQRKIKLDSPLVIVINERGTPPSWDDKLGQIISVATTVTSLVGIPIPLGVINRTKQFVKVLAGEERLEGGLIGGLQMAAQLAEYYAPETVKGVKSYVGEIQNEIGGYIKKGLNSVSPYFSSGMDINNINVLKQVETSLGLDVKEVEKLFNKYKTVSPFGKSVDLTKIVGDVGLSDLNKTVENVGNMFMLDTMRRHLKAEGGLISDIVKSSNPIADVPIIQDLFSSAGSNSVLATFPKIQEMTSELLNNGAISQIINGEMNAPDIKAALVGQVFGNIPINKDILKPLQLAALSSKAAAYSRAGDPFVLPDSISDEYKECYKYYIESDMNVPVIYCPAGWNWDKQLKKCVNPNAKVGYTNTQNSTNNATSGNTNTGNSIDLPKDEKKIVTGGGFDFGRDTGFSNTKLDLNFDLLKKTGNPEIEIGKPLPIDYVPPCLVKDGNNYFYYPYGKPETKKVEVISQRPSEKIITVAPKDLPITPMIGFTPGTLDLNSQLPKEISVSPLQKVATIPNGGVPNFSQGFDLAMPLPTLNDLPEKIQVFKSGSKWVAIINNKQYDFDPVNCKIIGYIEPNQEVEEKEKIVTKKELEREIAKREQERQEAEKKIREEAERRKQEAEDIAKEIENQKRLDELRRQNELLIEQNKKLQTDVIVEAKNNSNELEMQKLIDLVNIERKRANEALVQLNAEKTKGTDNSAFQSQLEKLSQNIELEKNRNNALQQEITLLKNKPVTVTTPTAQPTVNSAGCTDCDKLGMPKKVVKNETIIYGYPEQSCHSCPQCGGCDDECDCN